MPLRFRSTVMSIVMSISVIVCSYLATSNCLLAQSGSLLRNQRPVSFQQPLQDPSQMMQPPFANQPTPIMPPNYAGPMMGGPMNPAMLGMNDQNPLAAASWTFVPPTKARSLKIHDVISIRVSEMTQSNAQGTAQSRKSLTYDARLNDWLRMVGLDTLKPAKQTDGDQRIGGQESEVYRSDSNLRTREEITFNIAAEIADIRPNGNLVLSARKDIKLNDNDWEVSLSGICRPQDVGPDNVVLSKDILELKVVKAERGHVRDGYSRGWFTKWFARFKAF